MGFSRSRQAANSAALKFPPCCDFDSARSKFEQHTSRLLRRRNSGWPKNPKLTILNKIGQKLGKKRAEQMAELEAPFKWFTKEQEVTTMGLSIINICRLYRDYRQHWSLLVKLLSWQTPLGNIYLILETKLD